MPRRPSPPTVSTAKPWEHAKSGEGSASDPLAARFVESLSYDTRLYEADVRGSISHAQMLCTVGLITRLDLEAIERGLAEIKHEIESAPAGPYAVGVAGAWPGWKLDLEDVHMCIEAALIEKTGDAGRKLHTGRSRNDQVALDLRLWLRAACGTMRSSLDRALLALERLAEKQGAIVMPSYTHMQRAQPIALGGELMGWHAMLSRDQSDLDRLAEAGECPLGSGAVAGSSLPLDRVETAASLGFSHYSLSSIDATASRDEGLDFLYILSRLAMHLSRWAEQWIIYCTTEFGFLKLDERYTTGSSMMPQKRNPDMLELIRGRCGNVYGHFVALLTICKGLPIAYNRDLQEDKRHIFAAFDVARDCTEMAARIIDTAQFMGDRIAAGLDRGFLDATCLAEYFVTRGVPFRTSHQLSGSLVRLCESTGRHSLAQLTLDEMRTTLNSQGVQSITLDQDVYTYLGAARVVERYQSAGNAGRSGYEFALARAKDARAGAHPRDAVPTSSHASSENHQPLLSQAAQTAQVKPTNLFNEPMTPALSDERLIDAYAHVARTLDDLPYTPEFERLFVAIDAGTSGVSKRDVFHRLHNLRKAGKLPRVGRGNVSVPRIAKAEEEFLEQVVIEQAGSLGQRDQLPFTPKFDALVELFNQKLGRSLEPHDVWRLVAKLAK